MKTEGAELRVQPARSAATLRRPWERAVEAMLLASALASVAITLGIVGVLLYESAAFFTDTQWTPLFSEPHYGIAPLVCGTVVTTAVALAVAVPAGTIVAVYLSEYASPAMREIVKPTMELLSAVPTVVYGYFALLFVTPLFQRMWPELPGFNMLSAGLVIGAMIIPYVSSVSEDAMRAVPVALR